MLVLPINQLSLEVVHSASGYSSSISSSGTPHKVLNLGFFRYHVDKALQSCERGRWTAFWFQVFKFIMVKMLFTSDVYHPEWQSNVTGLAQRLKTFSQR